MTPYIGSRPSRVHRIAAGTIMALIALGGGVVLALDPTLARPPGSRRTPERPPATRRAAITNRDVEAPILPPGEDIPAPVPVPPDMPESPATSAATRESKPAAAVSSPIHLSEKFTRQWKSPQAWINKPEAVSIEDKKVNILNGGGENVVCKDEAFIPQSDGSLVLQWNYGENKTGYEVWTMKEKELVIERWNNQEEKDAGKPPRRVGFISSK